MKQTIHIFMQVSMNNEEDKCIILQLYSVIFHGFF